MAGDETTRHKGSRNGPDTWVTPFSPLCEWRAHFGTVQGVGISGKTGHKIFDRYQELWRARADRLEKASLPVCHQFPFQVENYIPQRRARAPNRRTNGAVNILNCHSKFHSVGAPCFIGCREGGSTGRTMKDGCPAPWWTVLVAI
jgi:hypothetical protein